MNEVLVAVIKRIGELIVFHGTKIVVRESSNS